MPQKKESPGKNIINVSEKRTFRHGLNRLLERREMDLKIEDKGAPRAKSYVFSIRNYILFSFILFTVSLTFGYSSGEKATTSTLGEFQELFSFAKEFSPFELVLFIFLNNSVKSFLVILLGIGAGLVPFFFISFNGMVIGLISYELVQKEGFLYTLMGFLPHGIIEIPAFLLSTAIGFRLGYEGVKKLRGEGDIQKEIKKGLRFFAYLILPLLFLAAVIEVFITPLLMSAFS